MRELIERKSAAKKSVDGQDMRESYYSASDGIYGIEGALKSNVFDGDSKLHGAFKKLMKSFDEFGKQLNARYDWD